MTDHHPPQQTLNIPSLILVLVLATFTIRYFFFTSSSSSSSSSSSRTSSSSSYRRGAPNPQHVEQIAAMFPQVGRREIMWDLQGNGGSVAATTERILGGRGLDVPPPSYRPILPSTTTTTTSTSTSTTSSSSTPTHPDLITRYNLASRLSSGVPAGEDAEAGGPSKPLWSNDGKERQALLQRRREEMVLNARRKLEAEEKQKREEEEERSRRRRGEIGGVGR